MSELKVVYIAGVGRSGSTLLDLILGDNAYSVSTGELSNLVHAMSCDGEYCSCGQQANKCEFWNTVLKEWEFRSSNNSINDFFRYQLKFERIRSLPYLLFSKLFSTLEYEKYISSQIALYESVSQVSNCKIVVDSSKKPIRAIALSGDKRINFNVLHLIRDGRGVAWSMTKSFEKNIKLGVQASLSSIPVWKTAINWSVINLILSGLARIGLMPRYLQVNYENLVENVEEQLVGIGRLLGVSYQTTIVKLKEELPLNSSHTIAGNRLRMQKTIKLSADYDWKSNLSESDKKTFKIIAGAVARGYGFKVD